MPTDALANIDNSLISEDTIFKNPVVNELSAGTVSNMMGNIQFPYVIKDKVLMSEGIWNNFYYSSEVIKDAFENTNWEDRRLRNLFLDHEDSRTSEWVGEVKNLNLREGTMYGDLIIFDPIFATKMEYGKPRFGISPKVFGDSDKYTRTMKSFNFENFSVVMNPAIKTAYINNSERKKAMPNENIEIDEELTEYSSFIKTMKAENPDMSYEQIAVAWVERPTENSELNEIKSQLNELEDIKSQLVDIKKILKIDNGGENMVEEVNAVAPKAAVPIVETKVVEPAPEVAPVVEAPVVAPVVTPVVTPVEVQAEIPVIKVNEEPIAVAPEPVAVAPAPVVAPIEPAKDELAEIASKLATIEKKLGAPDRLSVKGAPSNAVAMDPDEGMLKYLENMGSKEVR